MGKGFKKESLTEVLKKIINQFEEILYGVRAKFLNDDINKIDSLILKSISEIEQLSLKSNSLSGVPSGFHQLDKITGGWQKSSMIVIGGRPAMGKTAFVLSMVRNMAVDLKKVVAYFSLEMSANQLSSRLISMQTSIQNRKLLTGSLSDFDVIKLHSSISELIDAPIYIDDTSSLNILEFKAKSRRLVRHKKVDIIFIDYLQLMSAGIVKVGTNRAQEITLISKTIKEISRELNIPIVALSELNQPIECEIDYKRPSLSDLCESSSIEKYADFISFIYRPEYYGETKNYSGESNQGIAEILIQKHSRGIREDIRLAFDGECGMFKNIEE